MCDLSPRFQYLESSGFTYSSFQEVRICFCVNVEGVHALFSAGAMSV